MPTTEGNGVHDVDCPGCSICGAPIDAITTSDLVGPRKVSTIPVQARDKQFRIAQLHGNLFICSRANGNCCCGWAEKGRMPFENSLWDDEWERRRIRTRLHLSFTGCLGPCLVGNNALLQIHGRSIWFKDLNDATLVPLVFDYAEQMLTANRVLPPEGRLRDHVYERYVTPPDTNYEAFSSNGEASAGALPLDPVCLMEVDPGTAKWQAEHAGTTYYFCAPSCRRAFVSDPSAYV